MDRDNTPREELEEGAVYDSEEEKEKSRDSSRHRSKEKRRSRRDEKDHRSGERERSKVGKDSKDREKEVKDSEKEGASSKDKRKEDREDHEKDRVKGKSRGKDHDKEKHRVKDHDKDGKERGRKDDRERERGNEIESSKGREKERGKEISKDKEKEKERPRDRDRGKFRGKEKEKERTRDREREREREDRRNYDRHREEEKESKARVESDDYEDRVDDDGLVTKEGNYVHDDAVGPSESQTELEQRILKMKEERIAKKSEGASEILSWINRSRKIEVKKISEREKALRRSRMFEEQDTFDEDNDEPGTAGTEGLDALAGVKVLHGLDKVIEGGSVVLTLKDQEILANGDINEDVDMLENTEIGEQKRRTDAYKVAKKTVGVYDDKFNDEPGAEKKMLPQYDDPTEDQGVTLGAGGRFTAEAEKKLEELRRRLQGPSVKIQAEDLNLSAKMSSDYYTPEEMLKFKKPKKKKSLRKKDKLDIDALEAEALSAGLGSSDLGSRNDSRRQSEKEEKERFEADKRRNAFQTAQSKADVASRALRPGAESTIVEESDTPMFADDAEDLQKSLERARRLALKKQNEKVVTGPEAIAQLASSAIQSEPADAQNSTSGDADNKVVFTEMEEFVWGLQLDEGKAQKPDHEDVFMEEDEAPKIVDEKKKETGGWAEMVDSGKNEGSKSEDKEEVVPDEMIHEAPVGKGLSGALKLLKDRGDLKESVEWGGRNMDKKKSKLAGIYDEKSGSKEINLERTDEYGRVLTPKEAFRLLSHKFHGKGPGKMKQEKRMKQYHDELKLKQMTSSDTLPQSVERMRDAQSKLKSPYLVLSGQLKPGQTSDPRSGFATVEKEVPGSLTPMLGDKKVEYFLGIKRKGEPGSSNTPKKPKT